MVSFGCFLLFRSASKKSRSRDSSSSQIATQVEPDFSYDWDISFSTVSPLKLALGSDSCAMLENSLLSDEQIRQAGDDWVDTMSEYVLHSLVPRFPS